MTQTRELLFVYGSLRRAAGSAEADMLAAGADHLGPATARGKLYRIDWYPGMIASGDPADRVTGDLFSVRDPALWPKLDAYEGCGPADPVPQEYRRARIQVEAAEGSAEAWAYLYAWDVAGCIEIPGGDFLAPPEPPRADGR